MRYLSAEELLVLHALVVDETGGSHGVRDTALLASIAHKPQAKFDGKDLYPTIFLKAAILLEAVANYHVFIDGNKRTSFIAAARFLFVNGYNITADNVDVEKIVVAVAMKKLAIGELAEWLKENSSSIYIHAKK
ncbi:type II toxin-antitoxin system death-on-curing family toxin [Candidatus Kaiserbacteria bacterium]|nr:type II toxin-antitoxin system death-on-curing family toxin [Candidatus Kaiserbacteria bacterium]